MDYYNKLKMQEAQKLLTTHNELRVKDIAEILGFNDQYYFSKMFKAQCGVSPAAFKNGGIKRQWCGRLNRESGAVSFSGFQRQPVFIFSRVVKNQSYSVKKKAFMF